MGNKQDFSPEATMTVFSSLLKKAPNSILKSVIIVPLRLNVSHLYRAQAGRF